MRRKQEIYDICLFLALVVVFVDAFDLALVFFLVFVGFAFFLPALHPHVLHIVIPFQNYPEIDLVKFYLHLRRQSRKNRAKYCRKPGLGVKYTTMEKGEIKRIGD